MLSRMALHRAFLAPLLSIPLLLAACDDARSDAKDADSSPSAAATRMESKEDGTADVTAAAIEEPAGDRMVGVMGLNRDGLAFDTPDGRKVHCIVLLATPANERDRHLQVLATLARTLGMDPVMQAQLFNAKSPAHAYEMLHDEEAEDFNYFLED